MNKKELRALSKGELIRLFIEEHEARLRLEQRVTELERLLKSFDNPHMPSSKQRKKNTQRDENKPRFPGKPLGSAGGGIELPPTNQQEDHTLTSCPQCHGQLEPQGMRTQRVLDFPEKPLLVTEHHMLRYVCSQCQQIVEADGPRDSYGHRLRSAITILRNLSLSNQKVANFFRELGAPSLSAAEVQRIVDEMARKLEPIRHNIVEELLRALTSTVTRQDYEKTGKTVTFGVFLHPYSLSSPLLQAEQQYTSKNCLRGSKG